MVGYVLVGYLLCVVGYCVGTEWPGLVCWFLLVLVLVVFAVLVTTGDGWFSGLVLVVWLLVVGYWLVALGWWLVVGCLLVAGNTISSGLVLCS